jgi:hypothetical protein
MYPNVSELIPYPWGELYSDIMSGDLLATALMNMDENNEDEVLKYIEFLEAGFTSKHKGMLIAEEEVHGEKVVQEEGHLVEPEHIDFIFAPEDFELYEKARLLDSLPKIFSCGNRSRSWGFTTPCHTHSRRLSPHCYKPEPTFVREYTHVRGWAINDLKCPRQYKVNKVFEWRFGLGVSRMRSFSSLSVWK